MSKDGDTGLAPQPLPAPDPRAPTDELSGTVMAPSARPRVVPPEFADRSGSVDAPRPLPGVVRTGRERESSLAPLPIPRAAEPERRVGMWVAGLGCAAIGLFVAAAAVSGLAISLLR